MKTDKLIILASAAIFAALILLAVFVVRNTAVSINMFFVGILVLTIPYSTYKFLRFRKIKSYEREFPNFLRDVAEAQRAGLTLLQSFKSVTRGEYGALTHELRKMDKELSWNIQFDSVLKKFSARMSDSKVIVRSISIINQANKSGGNIEDTMESLASNIESIRELQEEKSSMLNQQVIMMYAIFFIFLGITLALIKFLVPIIQTKGTSAGSGFLNFNTNPCSVCLNNNDMACFGCNMFFGISDAFAFGPVSDPFSYYKSLFLSMILVQGFFTGLIAGQIGSDSVIAGVRHSMIMLFSGFTIFIVVIKLGIV